MHKHTQNCSCCVKAAFQPEKVSSLGKNWHRFCLKCERCSKILSPGGHAEHDGLPYCHKPCYGTLFGPKGMYNKMLLIGFSFESFWAFSASCSLSLQTVRPPHLGPAHRSALINLKVLLHMYKNLH
uniref:Cysteine rich protein 3 n=1 Tax=Sinocyclocheilus grahami TaxID=75366 RepID=A0A672R5L1_SINGR